MATASDRFNISSQLEHLQAKHVGTGHADLDRFEWFSNIKRDSYASFVGHHNMATYMALCENEAVGRSKYSMVQKMIQPCGVPPEKEED